MPTTRIPGPTGVPLIGSMFDLKRDPLQAYLDAQRDHGDLVRFSAGPPGVRMQFYMVFSPQGVQQVLASQVANFRKEGVFYEEVRRSFGNGLLTSQDDDYQRQRRLIQPLFTPRRVASYAAVMGVEAEALVARWSAAPAGVVDAATEMSRFTLRVVARILFGTDVETAVGVVRTNFPILSAHLRARAFSPLRLPRQWPTPGNRKGLAAERALYRVCDEIIARRGGEPTADLLGLLAAARGEDDEHLDPTELREQVLIFLFTGHETTATSLTFALHLLGKHPIEQQRVRAEVDALLGDGRRPTAEDYTALPHLTRVLKEALRLFPAAPVVPRRAATECVLDGKVIPAGADVLVSPYVTHRRRDHWQNPERFDPDRFTPEREAARHRYAWFPFGGGPRSCIGQHFSMLESVLGLATLLRAFEIEAVDTEVPLDHGITLEARGPVRIKLTPRERPSEFVTSPEGRLGRSHATTAIAGRIA